MAGPVLVLCLGNELRRDDGVGWAVGADLAADPPEGAVIRTSAVTGFHLLDELEGHQHVIVVDAIATGRHAPGTVIEFPLGALEAGPSATPHGLGLSTVLEMGGRAGLALPSRVDVVAVEIERRPDVGVGLGAAVRRAVPRAAAAVRRRVLEATGATAGRDAG